MKRLRFLLLDANVVIKLFELGLLEDVPSPVEGGMATPMFIRYPTLLC